MIMKPGVGNIVCDKELSMERWMSSLPKSVTSRPLNELAIPGSHDSFSYTITTKSDVAQDEPKWIQTLVNFFGTFGKKIIYRWSLTQNLTTTEQLIAGIRYFDCRVCWDQKESAFCFLHGLVGGSVTSCFMDIRRFLDSHPQEVVFLDFNHLYCMDRDKSQILLNMLVSCFGSKLFYYDKNRSLNQITLDLLWKEEKQVIIFYSVSSSVDYCSVWPEACIHSPWANTSSSSRLLSFLEGNYREKRPADIFYVWQGILTPSVFTVLLHLFSSLRGSLAEKIAPKFVKWIESKGRGKNGLNICIMDFVELNNYIPLVVGLNK